MSDKQVGSNGMTYASAGVDYDALDAFKRMAQLAGMETDETLKRLGFSVVPWSRGESASLIETPWGYIATVLEGLGTRNLVADAMYKLAIDLGSPIPKSYYDHVGIGNAATAFNDLATSGARAINYNQYVAFGDSNLPSTDSRLQDLVAGTKKACILARCPWVGGETPTLKGIIVPGTVDLAGVAVGIINPKSRLINPANIRHGDSIVLIGSSGVHDNGLTLARKISEKLPQGYLTKLSDGRTYGETLLDPTHIYIGLVEDCLDLGVDAHSAVNITGHGLRKLMRANGLFAYVVDRLPKRQPIFSFLQKQGPIDDKEAFGTFNMGAGFALYVPENDVDKVIKAAEKLGFEAIHAGHIEASAEKQVIIRPPGLKYKADTLNVR